LKDYIPDAKKHIVENFDVIYTNFFMQEFKQKLGFRKLMEGDLQLIQSMHATLKHGGFDWTNFFRHLHLISVPENEENATDLSNLEEAIDLLFSFRTQKELK